MATLGGVGTQLLQYSRLARLEKPVGWLLLLWPTLWALWVASGGTPAPEVLLLFVAGVVATRSLGCCINDLADRKLDARVARTASRPLAAGKISVAEALGVSLVLALVCLGLWLQLAPAARAWALLALLLALAYPFTKRVLATPQLFLGLTFGMGIPVAFAHVTGAVPPGALWLVAANLCWVFAYDTIYALIDIDDDRRAGNNSSALWLGERVVLAVALCYFMALALLTVYGLVIDAKATFYLVLGLAFFPAYRFVKQAATKSPASCQASFRRNHWFGAVIFAGFFAGI